MILFTPNIQHEALDSTTGYNWGKTADESNILSTLPKHYSEILKDRIISERLLVCDDSATPSILVGTQQRFGELLQMTAVTLLGKEHANRFGPYLGVVMKLLDTNSMMSKGGLSVQVHPRVGHPKWPSKPEMWLSRGKGNVYAGFNKDMTKEEILVAIENNRLEDYLNDVELSKETPFVVPGGLVHAIRGGNYLMEWSKAPGREEVAKGNIKDATVALYDRTDGKSPRPGKEDPESAFQIMEHAKTFTKTDIRKLMVEPDIEYIQNQRHIGIKEKLFRTPEVYVDRYILESTFALSLEKRGLPLYVESGELEIWDKQTKLGILSAGSEAFLAAHHKILSLHPQPNTAFYTWYRPF